MEDIRVLELFTAFYERGDTQSLADKLLHTCHWQQHDFKAYGHAQINEVLTNWLAIVGRCDVKLMRRFQSQYNEVFVLQLTPESRDSAFSLCLDVHHNSHHIKVVNCIVNTQQLSTSLGLSLNDVGKRLPQPDPLVVSDYDHQNHLQSDHAIPSMLIAEHHSLSGTLDLWWAIWSQGQYSQIDISYAQNATLKVPDSDSILDRKAFFDALSLFRSQFKRPFCQLLKVLCDQSSAFLMWYFEGDPRSGEERERIVFANLLQLENDLIVSDTLISDLASHNKRYPNSHRSNMLE